MGPLANCLQATPGCVQSCGDVPVFSIAHIHTNLGTETVKNVDNAMLEPRVTRPVCVVVVEADGVLK